jgi:hypothetical protein
VQLLATPGISPDSAGIATIFVDDRSAKFLSAACHVAGESVESRPLSEDRVEAVGFHSGNCRGVETAQPPLQLERSRECLLERHLLVKLESDQESERVRDEQSVGLVVSGERQSVGNHRG